MPTTDTQFKHDCSPENAQLFFHWIKTRGGVANWKSVNLSNPGASWSTPANDKEGKPYTKPSWQCSNNPTLYTSADEIGVGNPVLFKAFKVSLKRGDGFSFVITDASQRKVDKYLDACRDKHGDSYYKKGVLPEEDASIGIYYDSETISLTEWIEKNGEGSPEQWD